MSARPLPRPASCFFPSIFLPFPSFPFHFPSIPLIPIDQDQWQIIEIHTMICSMIGGVQSRFGGSHHSPAGAYEDQSSPVNTGYQPKNAVEKRRFPSAPPSVSDEMIPKGLINAPALNVTPSGQAAPGKGGARDTRRKRCASMHAEGRPPKVPPVNQSPTPLTPELV